MTDPRTRIDPELRQALDEMSMTPHGLFDLTDVPGTRAAVQAMAQQMSAVVPDDDSVSVEEVEASFADWPGVTVRVLRPRGVDGPLPALLWFHAGGQVLGFAAQDDAVLKRYCARLGCAAVSVDYRLAPESPAPAAAEDGYTAYRWALENAESLGLDPDRIGLAGQSGGGGVAAAVALMVRDRHAPRPAFQMLFYPMIDDRNETPSSREITDLGVWDRSANVLAWGYVLGDRAGTPDVTPYEAAARADDVSGLPPTFVAVGELDVFRDEDLDYARRLVGAGVPVELHLYPGAFHGFDVFAPESRLAASLAESGFGFLERQFARDPR